MTDPRAVLERFYGAETVYLQDGGDFGPMDPTLDPHCVMVQPESLPYAGEWRGHDGYRRWMDAFGEAWTSLSVTDPQIFVAGASTVFSRSTVVAKARATGTDITYPLLQMITIREDRIARIEPFYCDTHATLAVLGEAGT